MLPKNFNVEELACRHCGKLKLDPRFSLALDDLRAGFDQPMKVNSCCRCYAHNVAVGGHPRSLHICDNPVYETQQGALAIDISAVGGTYRGDLFREAWERGWSIGWGKSFLHLDRRDFVGLPQTTFNY